MYPNHRGEWVKYDDHLAALKRVEAERDELLGQIRNLKAAEERYLNLLDLAIPKDGAEEGGAA